MKVPLQYYKDVNNTIQVACDVCNDVLDRNTTFLRVMDKNICINCNESFLEYVDEYRKSRTPITPEQKHYVESQTNPASRS